MKQNRLLDAAHKTFTFGLFSLTMGLGYFTVYESGGIVHRRVTGTTRAGGAITEKSTADDVAQSVTKK